ncbi:hypothetical protein Patl1_37570 [Pistacia atlantica]|nr:hypothetical protein Patl1_37570 [Pistacia atlantica]
MLKGKKRYVLILDDVWKEISLEEVGITEPTVMDGCKLVLTTHPMEVARSMGCEEIKVEPLSEMEAFDLFLSKVGSELLDIPTLQSTLKQTVKQCDGLPLAIVTLANTMKGERDVHIWENALNELKACIASVENVVEKSRKAMYKKGHANLKRLERNCLLERDDGNCVKMHDLMRAMALYITRQSHRYLVRFLMTLSLLS